MSQAPTGTREHPLLAAVTGVRAGLAELGQANSWSLLDDELAGACEELTAAEAQLAAAELALIGEVGRRRLGAPVGSDTAGWLRGGLLMHPGEAARAVALAGALAGPLAATGGALAAGALSAGHARVITETMAALPLVPADVAGRAEAFLIGQATVLDPVLLGRAGRALIETLTSTPDADARIIQQEGRRQLYLTPAADGMVRLAGWLDPHAGATLAAAIDPLAAPRPAEDGSADPRPAARRRADALLDLIT
ncbi:MAG: 13E12 repeat family protein, partial [Actinomycetota bacterium]|nr:13E12 repeat family protein [Actinomycetota bacterium]